MKKLILFLFLMPMLISAQGNFNFDFDYARFGYDSVSNYVEFYYSFRQSDLSTVKESENAISRAVLHIELQDSVSGNFILNKDWRIDNPVSTTVDTTDKSLIGVVGFVVPKGVYYCVVSGSDGVDSTQTRSFSEVIKVDPLMGQQVNISDIQLSSNIKQENADSKSIFYKNTLEVMPNPAMIFGQGIPVLYYYSEIYNLKKDSLGAELKVNTMLINSKNKLVSQKVKRISRLSNSRVEVGTMNLTKYPTDSYTLVISLIDSVKNYGVTTAKRFYIYNPNVIDSSKSTAGNTDLLSSQYSVLSVEECDDLFQKSKYVAAGAEIDQYNKMESVEAKREFLYQFWKKRDRDPMTAENEFYNDYMNRVRVTEEKFGTINRSGVRTDRGRVFIIYGEPDEIDRYPNDIDKKPYEIWQYNQLEGGVIFVFGDVTGFSNYELLHSTKRGELRDDNWMRRIQTN